jgi:hypothetical protein
VRLPFLRDRTGLFWTVQVLNVLVGTAILMWGVPGFQQLASVSWMLGLLLFLHVAQNTRWLAERRREEQLSARQEGRASAIRAALMNSGTEPPAEGQ